MWHSHKAHVWIPSNLTLQQHEVPGGAELQRFEDVLNVLVGFVLCQHHLVHGDGHVWVRLHHLSHVRQIAG